MRREDGEVLYEGTNENKYIALHLLFHIELSFFLSLFFVLLLLLLFFFPLTLIKCTHDGPKREDTINRQCQQSQA